MPITPAENAFRKGLERLTKGEPVEATALFESAIRIERDRGTARPQMRYLSFYGLSAAMAQRATPETIQACEMAAEKDFFDAQLHLNLGRVYLIAGKTSKALAALERGLQVAPGNKALRSEFARANRRGRLPIPWLRRGHFLNCWLGKLRHSMAMRRARSTVPVE